MRTHHKCKIGGIVTRRGCMNIECTAHIAIKRSQSVFGHNQQSELWFTKNHYLSIREK